MSVKFETGQRIETYTIRQELGHGGMSDVFLAWDDAHDRDVVLKFPHEEIMGDPKAYEHFCREVKIGQILHHPNIQKLYALGGETQSPFLVLEYVPGSTLRTVFHERGKRPEGTVDIPFTLSLGIQIANALAYAHHNNVAHRDLKPENIIVMSDGTAKVMDFGIAFIEGARRVTWGMLSHQVGTPDYMAPEQIKGVRGDHRTDIYALGMILYESLAGRLPYDGDNALVIMNQHVTMKPPPLSQFRKGIPPAIEEIIMKAIRRNAADRWQTMEAFAEALEHPDSVDAAALRAEREREPGDLPASRTGIANELGLPLWQVVAITMGIFVAIALLGILAQYLHATPR